MFAAPPTPIPMHKVPLDHQGAIAMDVTCAGCGYILRGLGPAANCPECGKPVSDSLGKNRLALADLAWLTKLVHGATWILMGLLFGLVMFVLLGIIVTLIPYATYQAYGPLIIWGMGVPPGLMVFFGCWRLTTPEPGCFREGWHLARFTARLAAATIILLALVTGPFDNLIHEAASTTTFLLGGLAAMIGGFAALGYGHWLATRIPDRALIVQTRIVGLGYAGLLVVAGAVFLAGLALRNAVVFKGGPALPDFVFDVIALVAILGFLLTCLAASALGLWTVVLMIWYRQRLAGIVAQRCAS